MKNKIDKDSEFEVQHLELGVHLFIVFIMLHEAGQLLNKNMQIKKPGNTLDLPRLLEQKHIHTMEMCDLFDFKDWAIRKS